MARPLRVVLGPQRHEPIVREALADVLGDDQAGATVAAVTAGWEEREEEDGELRDHVAVPVVNLELFDRAERVFAADPDLFAAMRRRHDRLRRMQEVYRLRLSHALAAARELLRRRRAGPNGGDDPDADLLDPAVRSAIEAVTTLDSQHTDDLRAVHAAFEAEVRPARRPAVARARAEVRDALADCSAVCIAGGHVVILLNRLTLFDLREELAARPLVVWSAGAMALSERVVVFHDSPPQGAGDPEVLEAGLGLLPGIVPLPHAKSRLRLEDPDRVALFARRFGPAACLALDARCRADWDGAAWTVHPGTRSLSPEGSLTEGGVAARAV